MRSSVRSSALAAAMLAASATLAAAQQPASLITDLVADVSQVEQKMLGLARAMNEQQYAWGPGAPARTVGQVFMHVAADNYLFPAVLGTPADPATGIKGEDYKTAMAFESRKMSRDSVIAELEKSFAFLRKTMQATPADRLGQQVSMFGQKFTGQQAWIMATTHLHEHLGQAIAYARSNNVKPPWSQ